MFNDPASTALDIDQCLTARDTTDDSTQLILRRAIVIKAIFERARIDSAIRPILDAYIDLVIAENFDVVRDLEDALDQISLLPQIEWGMEALKGGLGFGNDPIQVLRDAWQHLAKARTFLDDRFGAVVLATDDNFAESGYLELNVDVAMAVKSGALSSGREHFESIGKQEGRMMRVGKR